MLSAGQYYMFAVRAVNAIGYGPYSSATTIMAASVPGAPAAPIILSASSAFISIQWTAPTTGGSPITNYNVYVATGTVAGTSLLASTGLTTQYIMTSVVPAETYWFYVQAVNAVG
jgi:titin